FAADRLWLLDRVRSRLVAMRPDTFQVIAAIPLDRPIDATVDDGRVFTLDATGIAIWNVEGRLLAGSTRERLSNPVAIGAGRNLHQRWIYVIDLGASGFLRYSAKDAACAGQIGDFSEAGTGFAPALLVVDPEGNLFVSDRSPVVHELSPDGGYIGP